MKYRHHGYRDDDYRREREREHERERPRRGPREIATREATVVIRCWQCGTHQEPDLAAGSLETCTQCRADLHCCRNCRHFDPGARFQCREPIEKAYRDKTVRNDCARFEPRHVLDSTGRRARRTPLRNGADVPSDSSSGDPREAFEKLFK